MTSLNLSRRTILKGLGTTLALPWLEAMGPLMSWADTPQGHRAPNRMAFVYVPNGINMADWTPRQEGREFELPHTLRALVPFQNDINVLTGLTADKARANGDGGGDHARAMAAFLTGVQPRKTDGTNIRAGVSVDQVAASRLGDRTRLASLEIGADPSNMAGNCDSGYSCVYNSTISWRSATTPLPKLNNPRLIFERLFGSGTTAERLRRDQLRRSILDTVREDARSLQGRLSTHDQHKLEEYFTAVRDIEERIGRAARLPAPEPGIPAPAGIPTSYQDHLRLLCDLLVLSFQTDITRISTCVFANEGSNRAYPFINVREGHHDLSHHQNNQEKKNKLRDINTFHATQFAYLLEKLRSVREGDGTLLDHCMVIYGSGNSDGNRHNHDDLPIVQAGKACGTIQTGRHLRYPRETPLNNLWLSMLDRMDSGIETLGDSTGRLRGLEG